jgi:DNA polymerase-3 subunit alpha
VEEVNQKDILAWEKELVGTYLLDHPTQKFMADIKAANATLLAELDESMHGRQVNVAGVISSIRHHQSKKGEPMAFIEIEDAQATREVIVFPRAFAAYKTLLIEGKLIFVRGKVDAAQEGRPPKILADTITTELTSYHASNGDTPAPRPNGANGNGAAKPAASSAYRLPEPPALPPDILLAEAPVAYHTPESLPPAIPPIVDETLARWLHIRIPPTGNLPRDKERMRRIFALLTDRPGNDLFSFHIPNGPKEIQIDFPNQTTKYTEYLRQQLNLAGITDVWLD